MRLTGIYQIHNIVSGGRYYGKAVDLARRWRRHRYDLKADKHFNPHLQRAWNRYGAGSFVFSVVELCATEELPEKEQMLLRRWVGLSRCYNTSLTSDNPMQGRKHSAETRQKMSQSHKGKTVSEGTREKMSAAKKGITLTEAQIEARTGWSHSEEWKAWMSKQSRALSSDPTELARRSKPVVGYCPKTGVVVVRFSSGINAERLGGFSQSCVTACANHQRKTHRGLRWEFESNGDVVPLEVTLEVEDLQCDSGA